MVRVSSSRVETSLLRIEVLYKAIFLSLISVLFLILEPRVEGIKAVRVGINYGLAPLQSSVDWIIKQQNSWSLFLTSKDSASHQLKQIQEENLLLKEQVNRLGQASNENKELRRLLDYKKASPADKELYVARVIGGNTNSVSKQFLFDLGSVDGIKEGMIVLSANGLLGQVVSVGFGSSRALLITDPLHSVPVKVARSNNRFILDGLGKDRLLSAIDLHADIDVRKGDVLVTSGLGGKFPPGIPVAKVSEVVKKDRVSLRDLYAVSIGRPSVTDFILVSEGLSDRDLLQRN